MLTYTEIQEIRHTHKYDDLDFDWDEYKKMLDDALEKQIPKKPNIIPETQITTSGGNTYTVKSNCPRCGVPFIENCIPLYCAKCGQALLSLDEEFADDINEEI